MTETATFKTVAQIKAETDRKQYYRPFDYACIVALTKFIEHLERKHGEDFKILTVHPAIFYNRGNDKTTVEDIDRTGIFGLGLWVRWLFGDTEYYMQMNENPFFPAYFTRTWRNLDGKTRRSEYATEMNEMMYAGVDIRYSEDVVRKLVQNFKDTLDYVNKRCSETYTQEIPAYDRKVKQTIYRN